MSMRPRATRPGGGVFNQEVADALHAVKLGAATGVASVPDISEHNALEARVAALEKGQTDMDARIGRVEARIEAMLSDVKALVSKELASVNAKLRELDAHIASDAGKFDQLWAKILQVEARIGADPVEPKGFQENDSPFPRSTMGRPRGGF